MTEPALTRTIHDVLKYFNRTHGVETGVRLVDKPGTRTYLEFFGRDGCVQFKAEELDDLLSVLRWADEKVNGHPKQRPRGER